MAVSVSATATYATSTTNVVSATISATSGALLVAMVGVGNDSFGTHGAGTGSVTMSDTQSGTWTRLVMLATAAREEAEIWVRDVASTASVTVTATGLSGQNDASMQLVQCAGAAPAASQTGGTGTTRAFASMAVSVTTTTVGSLVFGVIVDSGGGFLGSTKANTTEYSHYTGGSGGDVAGQWVSAATVSAPGATSYGYSGSVGDNFTVIAAEVLPTAGPTPITGSETGSGAEGIPVIGLVSRDDHQG